MDENSAPSDPGQFLAQLGEELAAEKEYDQELLTILRDHVLIAAPVAKAVENALELIQQTARERASSKREGKR